MQIKPKYVKRIQREKRKEELRTGVLGHVDDCVGVHIYASRRQKNLIVKEGAEEGENADIDTYIHTCMGDVRMGEGEEQEEEKKQAKANKGDRR